MKHTIILSILLAACLSAEETTKPTEPPPLDLDLKELLESTKIPYTFAGDNTPYFKIPQDDGKVEYVYVLPATDQFGSYTIRRIVAFVYQEEKEKPSPEIMENALMYSKDLRTSRFQLAGSDDSSWSLCLVGLFPNSGDQATFKQMVEGIGYTSWDFKKKYIDSLAPAADTKNRENAENFEIAFQLALEDEDVLPIPEEGQKKMRKDFGEFTTFYLNENKDMILCIDSTNPLDVEVSMEFTSVPGNKDILTTIKEVCDANPGLDGGFHAAPQGSKQNHLFYTLKLDPSKGGEAWQDATASSIFALGIGEKLSQIIRERK